MLTLEKLSELKQDRRFILVVIIFMAIFFAVILIQDSQERKEFRSIYAELKSKEIFGIVKVISTNRGGKTIELDKLINKKLCFLNFTVDKTEEWDIHQFISPGDSIYKAGNSMELIVVKRTSKIKTILKIR